ncbi:MAG: xylulokinase [Thermomicrobiales bacterium]|nr:xylulokinase [Thermomicrobiales bacterium]
MAHDVVLGVDSSTQSTKVVALDLDSGAIVGEGRAPHSGGHTQHPTEWWDALVVAVRSATSSEMRVRSISVGGQQHGLVALDAEDRPVGPASLWNNTDAAPDAARLNTQADFAALVGSRLVASITIAKLAHLARIDPERFARVRSVCLPHDWITFQLTGRLVTDRGDASGTGWWSPVTGAYRRDLIALAVGEPEAARIALPDVLGPTEPAGALTSEAAAALGLEPGIAVGPGTGDNMAAALGIGAADGEITISLGTSGTAFAVSATATTDETGEVAGFADATGRFLPLACMLNCTRVVDTIAALLGIDRVAALDRAGAIAPGAEGLLLMPYLDGERTPNLPRATGSLNGLTARNATPDLLLRAALDGVAAGLAYSVEALARLGITAPRATLVGGGSQHAAWRQAIADATGMVVVVRGGGEHAARGAGAQAAAVALAAPIDDVIAAWRPPVVAEIAPRIGVREAFRLSERRTIVEALQTREG